MVLGFRCGKRGKFDFFVPGKIVTRPDDFHAHRPLELQAIYKNAINIAKKHNVAMPLTEKLYEQLLVMTRSPSFPLDSL